MIQTERINLNGETFLKTFSDKGFYILNQQSGEKYEVAFDYIYKTKFYIETDELIYKGQK